MLADRTNSTSRHATQHILHLGAIVAAIVLLILGLYSVAREAGRLLELTRATTPAAATAGLLASGAREIIGREVDQRGP